VKAEVWNIDIAAKSSEYSDVQLSSDDTRPGRRFIAEHVKVVDTCHSACFTGYSTVCCLFYIEHKTCDKRINTVICLLHAANCRRSIFS